jgi:hypothetical protein
MERELRDGRRSRKVRERRARYFEGKIPVDANELSLKEASE